MKTTPQTYTFAAVATDVAMFTVRQGQLHVLLIKMKKKPFTGKLALPCGLINPKESVDNAAHRILQEKTGVAKVYLEQLSTFGEVDRDPFGRVVSIAYYALIPADHIKLKTTSEHDDVAWYPISKVPALAYDHTKMLAVALTQLQNRLEYSNIAYSLLPREFTLTDLQEVYEIILGYKLDKRNFRKRVLSTRLVQATGKKRRGETNRPAALYSFRQRQPQTMHIL